MKRHIVILAALMAVSACTGSISFAAVEQAVNFYTKGNLINPSSLSNSDQDSGILKIFQPRHRNYGSFELISMIRTVAQEIAQKYPSRERLQIGDVANLKGGSIGSHKSHQNGLDADVVYFRKNNQEQDPQWIGKYVEKFVKNGKLSPNFDTERNWAFLEKLTSFPQVQRIFVDINIKKNLCALYASSKDLSTQRILRTLRPAPLHDDHMHIRIACPPGSIHCIPQPLPPEGNGCSSHQMEMDLREATMDEATGC